MVKGVTSLLLILLLAGAGIAGSAQAGKTPFAVKAAKHKDGPYVVDVKAKLKVGESASLWWRIKSRTDSNLELVFDEPLTGDTEGYRVRWFKAGKDVTSEVEGAGYELNVKPGQTKYFNLQLKRRPAGDVACIYGQATDGINYDAATASINELCTF